MILRGKAKAVYRGSDEDSLFIRFNDDTTAFDGEKAAVLPGKGAINAEISAFIYRYLAENGIATHLIDMVDENTALVRRAEIIMIEVIVRNIAAGGFSRKYGIAEGSPLKNTIIEFGLKDDALHDPMINESQITAIGLASADELAEMSRQANRINELLTPLFDNAGIILVDFKLEFGRYGGGIILCDEISPDSCRLWDKSTMEKLDKDRFRRDLGDVLFGYRQVLNRIKGIE